MNSGRNCVTACHLCRKTETGTGSMLPSSWKFRSLVERALWLANKKQRTSATEWHSTAALQKLLSSTQPCLIPHLIAQTRASRCMSLAFGGLTQIGSCTAAAWRLRPGRLHTLDAWAFRLVGLLLGKIGFRLIGNWVAMPWAESMLKGGEAKSPETSQVRANAWCNPIITSWSSPSSFHLRPDPFFCGLVVVIGLDRSW